ncbi:MAG TPA: hypothetical protein VGF07_03365, partial [Stellaceae bacterium]
MHIDEAGGEVVAARIGQGKGVAAGQEQSRFGVGVAEGGDDRGERRGVGGLDRGRRLARLRRLQDLLEVIDDEQNR